MESRSGRLGGVALALLIGAAGAACTWVPLTAEGEAVRVLPSEATASCEELGRTRSRTTTKVAFFGRSPVKVREELVSLARNEAGRMEGNAVSALGPEEGGEQLFGVYRCPGQQGRREQPRPDLSSLP